mmetsp:Transcript_47338/g.110333  ORF Transcript_47338/g.110333 Transcript_47338/m.110333 type:complete len:82 (-) Transcript_47338:239-484(-)
MLSRPLGQCMLSPKPCKCVATTSQMLGFDEGEVMLDKEELVMKTVTFSPWIEGISYQVQVVEKVVDVPVVRQRPVLSIEAA